MPAETPSGMTNQAQPPSAVPDPPAGDEASITALTDKLYEFEREPVSRERLEPGRHFAAVFAGEHVAGTEFVIGATFVSWGATASDVLLGLLLGNLLAVLSWTFICAPIAVQTRLTLYWYLRKIAGPPVTAVYNVLNAFLFCILAGTMITVSASAIRIPFGIPPQTNWYPEDIRFVLVVIVVGAVVVGVAILGFRRLAQFSEICVPWIFIMFFAGAIAMLPALAAGTEGVGSIGSFADFYEIGKQKIWIHNPESGMGFWHVAAFAWICNLAFHVGLSDMALLRYAKRPAYGLYSAFGMYLGHYMAWVAAGVMGAAAAHVLARPLVQLDAGEVAYQSLGFSGAIAVILAGWATSNPTLYRAGLALQVVTPNKPRWLVTLFAGIFTTAIACFPFVFGYLLEFVAFFGILLMPVGAIVFIEHWVFPKIGLVRYWTALSGRKLNWPALVCWALAVGTSFALYLSGLLSLYFLTIPIWLLTVATYIPLAAMAGARQPQPPPGAAPPPPGSAAHESPVHHAEPGPSPRRTRTPLVRAAGAVALVTLIIAAAIPVWVLVMGPTGYEQRLADCKTALAWVSVAHLIAVGIWVLATEEEPGHQT